MTRQHTALALLVVTASLMAAALVFLPPAQSVRADMQASSPEFLLMTARAADNADDSVIVLDNRTGKLLTYQLRTDTAGAARLLLTNPVDLTKVNTKPKP